MAAIVALPATFGLHGWKQAAEAGDAAEFGSARLLERIRFATASGPDLLEAAMAVDPAPHAALADAAAALAWIGTQDSTPPLWLGITVPLLPASRPDTGWTGLNDPASFVLLPPREVERFISHGAQALRRPGWILADSTRPDPWLAMFGAVYDVQEVQRFGGYTVYRILPR
jgi:hypothetical protein